MLQSLFLRMGSLVAGGKLGRHTQDGTTTLKAEGDHCWFGGHASSMFDLTLWSESGYRVTAPNTTELGCSLCRRCTLWIVRQVLLPEFDVKISEMV